MQAIDKSHRGIARRRTRPSQPQGTAVVGGRPYPLGSASTKVSSILSLLPPSDARPACISTTMASTTWRSLAGGVAHPPRTPAAAPARRHRARADALRATSAAAIAQVTAAHPTATPSPTLPISSSTLPSPPPPSRARGRSRHPRPPAAAPSQTHPRIPPRTRRRAREVLGGMAEWDGTEGGGGGGGGVGD